MGAGYRFQAKAAEKAVEILIYEDVGAGWFGGVTAKQVADDLRGAGKPERIDVRIASYGGDIVDGLAIYRLLADHNARVVAHIDSVAASVASVIAMAGDEIVIAEAGSLMIHEAWTIAAGHAKDMRAKAAELESASSQLAEIYAARTGQPLGTVKAWMAETKWFYGQEAVDAKFAHRVAENVRLAASANSMWHSVMQGRIATGLQVQQAPAGTPTAPAATAQPHAANDDVRAQLGQLTTRLQASRLTRTRGAGV